MVAYEAKEHKAFLQELNIAQDCTTSTFRIKAKNLKKVWAKSAEQKSAFLKNTYLAFSYFSCESFLVNGKTEQMT